GVHHDRDRVRRGDLPAVCGFQGLAQPTFVLGHLLRTDFPVVPIHGPSIAGPLRTPLLWRCFPYPGDGGRFLRGAFLRTYVSSHDHPGQGESTHHQAAVQGGGAAARALSHHSTNSTRVITKSVRGVRGSAKCLSTASLRSDGPSSQFGDALS